MKEKIGDWIRKTKGKFTAALPVILFFLFLFYTVILFFGVHYVMVVSITTVLFKVHYRKQLTFRRMISIIAAQFLLMGLAYLATWNLAWCVLLNMTVPFVLVFLRSSQFNQLGYFAWAMCFVFLQMNHLSVREFSVQAAVMAYAMAVFAGIWFLFQRNQKQGNDYALAQKGTRLLARAVEELAGESVNPVTVSELFVVQQGLYKAAYQSRGANYIVTGKGKIQYMFALLFQRVCYFLQNPQEEKQGLSEETRSWLQELADYLKKAGERMFEQGSPGEELEQEAKRLLGQVDRCERRTACMAQNLLRTFLLILEDLHHVKGSRPQYDWKLPKEHRTIHRLLHPMKPDVFETRFAMRLSFVLTIGFTYNMTIPAEHGYWLVLNAFILLRPMYEDSAYRMKTRFVGTAAGCVVLHVLLLVFTGNVGHFLLTGLMVAGMYTETPGTMIHAVFVTCFALTMTTMALPQNLAMELRLLYVAAAVLLVLVINRFVFPTSLKSQFQYNIQLLFHMQHLYLRMVHYSIRERIDYGTICDAQIHYHLVYDQIQQYIQGMEEADRHYYQELILLSWLMVSESEQMLFLINGRRITLKDAGHLEDYLEFTDLILGDIQEMMDVRPKYRIEDQEKLFGTYRRTIEDSLQLSTLLEQYAKQMSSLYLLVLSRVRNR